MVGRARPQDRGQAALRACERGSGMPLQPQARWQTVAAGWLSRWCPSLAGPGAEAADRTALRVGAALERHRKRRPRCVTGAAQQLPTGRGDGAAHACRSGPAAGCSCPAGLCADSDVPLAAGLLVVVRPP